MSLPQQLPRPWTAFADGACKPNPGAAAVGAVVFDPVGREVWRGGLYLGERFVFEGIFVERGTNQIAELIAVVHGLAHVPDGVPIVVRTDSRYAVGLGTGTWRANANRELVALVRQVVAERGARVQWVPGHTGIVGNEVADQLANAELERRGLAFARMWRAAR